MNDIKEKLLNRRLKAVSDAKEFLLNSPQQIDTERLKCLVEVYQEFEHEPVIVKRALVFERLLQTKHLYIDENPIVGTVTGKPAGVYLYPEFGAEWMLKEMRQAMMSHLGSIGISEDEKKIMLDAAKFFRKRCAANRSRVLSIELDGFDPDPYIKAGVFTDGSQFTLGAGNADYETFINRGLKDIIEETQQRLDSLVLTTETTNKINYYRAVLISLKALITLAHRYADLAESMAENEADEVRRIELQEIAEVCRYVPENPPRNFREALQFWWFLQIGIHIEQSGCGSSPGRLGQYLNPYYQKDKLENGITREEGIVWLKCLFVKILEYGYYQGLAYAQLVSGHTGHTINVGGLTADGHDATCELDYMLLDVQIALRNIQPTITVLYHDNLPEDFLLKAVELERTGLGQPQWMNVNVIIPRLLARHAANGITLREARQCVQMSCVSTGVAGKTSFMREIASFNLAKMVEFVMTNGYDYNTDSQIGLATGDPETFTNFEDFFKAFELQVANMFKHIRRYGSISNKVLAETVPNPLRSSMYHGCLERGKHEFEGGPDYYVYYEISTAGVDAANALAAVKHLVYDTKSVTMAQLKEALSANFEGYEEIQKLCINSPKHGNGDPEMDHLVRRVYDCSLEQFRKAGSSYYGKHVANIEAYSLSIHNYFGMLTGALPTGRKKGLPLTDASVSPAPGTDKNGPLALISSAAQALDTVDYASNHFNMKFHPTAIAGAEGARKLLSLIKTYMDMGGSHIQFNVVSAETLRAAQQKPEEYKDLTVRVAGFSAYYTRLHKGVQDEILKRTEYKGF